MRTFLYLIVLIFTIQACEDKGNQINANLDNNGILEITYSIDNVFGRHLREITVFPYEIKYYEKLWNGELQSYIETKKTKNLSYEDWKYLINSIDTNEFYDLKDFYKYTDSIPPMDGEVYSIEIKTNTKVKKVSYETLGEITVIKALHTKLFELTRTFD